MQAKKKGEICPWSHKQRIESNQKKSKHAKNWSQKPQFQTPKGGGLHEIFGSVKIFSSFNLTLFLGKLQELFSSEITGFAILKYIEPCGTLFVCLLEHFLAFFCFVCWLDSLMFCK